MLKGPTKVGFVCQWPRRLGSIPGWVIPKTQKMVLDAALFNTQHYKIWIKGKVGQSWERSSALPKTLCSSYWKGSLQVTLDSSCQLYLYEYNWKLPCSTNGGHMFSMNTTYENWCVVEWGPLSKIQEPHISDLGLG